MGKRYVYWRRPDGRPHTGDDEQYAPTALLAKIGSSAKVASDGGVSWTNFDLTRNELAVRSAVVILDVDGNELNETDASQIIADALAKTIRKVGGGKPILAAPFFHNVNELAASHFRKPYAEYVLISSLSIENLPATSIRIRDCRISAIKGRGTRFQLPKVLTRRIRDDVIHRHLTFSKYQAVKVATRGRSIYEATENAFDALNLLRGLWTLFSTFGRSVFRLGSSKPEPIGAIYPGAIHTLHNLDGTPAHDIYWYEPEYTHDREVFVPKAGWAMVEKERRIAMRQIAHCPYGKDIEHLLMRYAEALDYANLDVAFLKMWSILEKITDTVGARYDETINRTAWIFHDRRSLKELLGHLRFCRNQYVHAAKSSSAREETAYLMKSVIDPHLLRLIRNSFRVGSLKEYGEFLTLPTNVGEIERKLSRLKRAQRIWTPK